MTFVDEVKIYIKAGDGGNGCSSFRREKYIPFGGPNGGNGGRGGSIIIKAVANSNSLLPYRYKQHFKATKGSHGKGRDMDGVSGGDLVLEVPIGTEVCAEDKETLIADLTQEGDYLVAAEGGRGGLGNTNFKSSTNRAPRKITEGGIGEETWLWMKLKLFADVGIIGLPNAGKSTLLSVMSEAKPKIGNYPFTTLRPEPGLVKVDYDGFVMNDIPGIIEGANEGLGIGSKFLKHVERCKVLMHLLDITSKNLLEDYKVVRKELKSYSSVLAGKRELIVLSKSDLVSEEERSRVSKDLAGKLGQEVLTISSSTNHSVTQLKYLLHQSIQEEKNLKTLEEA